MFKRLTRTWRRTERVDMLRTDPARDFASFRMEPRPDHPVFRRSVDTETGLTLWALPEQRQGDNRDGVNLFQAILPDAREVRLRFQRETPRFSPPSPELAAFFDADGHPRRNVTRYRGAWSLEHAESPDSFVPIDLSRDTLVVIARLLMFEQDPRRAEMPENLDRLAVVLILPPLGALDRPLAVYM